MIVLAFTLAAAYLLTLAGVLTVELAHPETDTRTVVEALAGVFTTFVGVVLGYMAGRRGGD